MPQAHRPFPEPDPYFVGRAAQLERFRSFLTTGATGGRRFWNIYGTAGVGKSTLLDMFQQLAQAHGAALIRIEGGEAGLSGEELCRQILGQMASPAAPPAGADPAGTCLDALARTAAERRLILAFNTYEKMGHLDGWLRTHLFPLLPEGMLVILSGRAPLKGPWLVSPHLREQVEWMQLDHLSFAETQVYLEKLGIGDRSHQEAVWKRSQGHPLTLSLAAAVRPDNPLAEELADESFRELVAAWLREVQTPELRRLVEAASVLRHFHQELLAEVMEAEIAPDAFDQLVRLSFIRRTGRGWTMHELARDAIRRQLRERQPTWYGQLLERCVRYFASAIAAGVQHRDVAWEVGQLLSYVGDATTRALFHEPNRRDFHWVPLSEENLAEAEAYMHRRLQATGEKTATEVDPETGAVTEITLTAAEETLALKGVDLRALVQLGRNAALILRDQQEQMRALAVIIPFQAETMGYLKEDPLAGPYLASLTPQQLRALESPGGKPQGWFIRTIDTEDWTDRSLSLACADLIFAYMCRGAILVASPPPIEVGIKAHVGIGFEPVPGAEHTNYDGKTPTAVFALDTRGERLVRYLQAMLRRIGVEWGPPEPQGGAPAGPQPGPKLDFGGLTEREQEVVALVLEGLTNVEIAERLFVTEATVKKHLTSIYERLQVKSRSQLVRLVLERTS